MKPRFGEPDYGYEALVLSYSGYYLAVRSPVVVFNAHQGRLLGWIPVHFRMFNSSALSICPNERYLAFSEYKDNTIPIVDLATGQILQVIEVPQMYSRICLFTPQSDAVLWQGYSGLVGNDVIRQPLGTGAHQRFAPCNIPVVANGDLSLSGNWLTLNSDLYRRDEHHHWKCSPLQFCSNNLTASSISPSERLVLYVTDEKLILVETLTATVCMELEARHKPSESDEQSNRSHGMPCRRGFRSAALSPDETWLVASEASAQPRVYFWHLTESTVQPRSVLAEDVTALNFAKGAGSLGLALADKRILVWHNFGWAGTPHILRQLCELEFVRHWHLLTKRDAKAAYPSMLMLASGSDQTVQRLSALLKPEAKPDPAANAYARSLIRQLLSDDIVASSRARQQLRSMGWQAESALREALRNQINDRKIQALEELLNELSELTPERLRQLRALQVLYMIRTAAAEKLLRQLAQGAENSLITRDAQWLLKVLSHQKANTLERMKAKPN
ncbi:MAG: hypothetical protein RMJ82_15510 [Gemmatales bacterium]|nr:hypothetical protein [Gemmatales bacterium]